MRDVPIYNRLVVLESGLRLESGLKPLLLEFDLVSDLVRFVTKSTFSFHCAHLQCFVLDYNILPTRIVHDVDFYTVSLCCWIQRARKVASPSPSGLGSYQKVHVLRVCIWCKIARFASTKETTAKSIRKR